MKTTSTLRFVFPVAFALLSPAVLAGEAPMIKSVRLQRCTYSECHIEVTTAYDNSLGAARIGGLVGGSTKEAEGGGYKPADVSQGPQSTSIISVFRPMSAVEQKTDTVEIFMWAGAGTRLATRNFALPIVWPRKQAGPFTELELRELIMDDAEQMFRRKAFVELERMAEELRVNQTRTPSGLWKLTHFYRGLVPEVNDTEAALESTRQWRTQSPRSPVAHLAHTRVLSKKAWAIRGSGFAHEVKPESWKAFKDGIREVRLALESSKAVASTDPTWYVQMLELATDEGWERSAAKALLEEATSKFPYSSEIYFAAGRYFSPIWHGDANEIEALARFAVEKTKEKEGQSMYTRVYWNAANTQYRERLFRDSAVDWSRMKLGMHDILDRYPDQWNINNFAYYACLAKDPDETLALIKRMEMPINQFAWGEEPYDTFKQCKEWATNAKPEPAPRKEGVGAG